MITFLTTAFLNELSLTSHTYFQFEPYLVRWRGTQIDLQRHVLGEYWGNMCVKQAINIDISLVICIFSLFPCICIALNPDADTIHRFFRRASSSSNHLLLSFFFAITHSTSIN